MPPADGGDDFTRVGGPYEGPWRQVCLLDEAVDCGLKFGDGVVGAGLASALVFATSAVAQQRCSGPQLGTWKLQSDEGHELATGEKYEPLGVHPTGYISYGSDCRMQVIEVRDGRKAPANLVPTDAERVALYDSFLAYAGTYSIKGDIVSHHIDASWNQTWVGTTMSRHLTIDGKTLLISGNFISGYSGKSVNARLTWTKVE